ncbi:MAG TPA: hypothetical protein DCE48_09255 [Lachnospiraceae bacterium]|uniref:hypothetical protein n=1 Tax=Anaerosporobacter sp. TaxID=1872529 RepID=UPI000EE1EBA7|nr:hypothetical protein [Anaerosporobacter sp.]HAB60875.1 hypothetical protein [Lachnospiraceae bacterium]
MITWSYRETDELWQHEEFETVDECIKDAKENYGMKVGEKIAIGTVFPFEVSIDIESMLERVEELAYEECGEVSESWGITSRKLFGKEMNELQNKVTELVNEYLEIIDEKPTFYKIDNICTVTLN